MKVLIVMLLAAAPSASAHTLEIKEQAAKHVQAVIWQRHDARHLRKLTRHHETRLGRHVTSWRPLAWRVPHLKFQRAVASARLRYLLSLPPRIPHLAQWLCIHQGEGAWNSNTGNGYYGGLQMDISFMRSYGADMIRKYGGYANLWSPADQMIVAERAWSTRGFAPWPNTARACGLL